MKSNSNCVGRFAAVLLCAIPTWALAHHGIGAQFDLSETIELQGEVRQLLWQNPHVRFTVGVADANGEESLWVVEAQSVSMLRQRDITEALFNVGDQILLAGNPARGGKLEIYATNVLLPDGREVIFAQNAEPRWRDRVMGTTGPRFATTGDSSAPELGLFRVWNTRGPNLWRNFDLATSPLTDEARAAGRAYDRSTDNLAMGECVSAEMPRIIGNPYPRDFVDQGDTILMRLEEYDAVRTIHMTPAPPGEEPPDSPLGYSVGRWENDTLVVTTTKIRNATFRLGIPLGEDLEIVERFTPSADGSRLDYRMTVTDPTVFLEPAEFDTSWIYIPGATVEPYDCTEG
jgi:hypothetical protein